MILITINLQQHSQASNNFFYKNVGQQCEIYDDNSIKQDGSS